MRRILEGVQQMVPKFDNPRNVCDQGMQEPWFPEVKENQLNRRRTNLTLTILEVDKNIMSKLASQL